MILRQQSKLEEYFNSASHFLALSIFLIYSPTILFFNTNESIDYSIAVFIFGLTFSYLASGVYHFLPPSTAKTRWRIADHVGIYFIIGGSYTPIILHYIEPQLAQIFLACLWTMLLLGSILKIWFTGRFENLSTLLYVFLGWMIIFVAFPMWNNAPSLVLWWILIGGLSYTAGIYFFYHDQKKYYHNIWHLFVIGGTASHYIAIYYMLALAGTT